MSPAIFDQFLSVLTRFGLNDDMPSVAMNIQCDGSGSGEVTVYGIGQTISKEVLGALEKDVFPLMRQEYPRQIIRISDRVLGPDDPAALMAGWELSHRYESW